MFQSAPLTKARGDHSRAARPEREAYVSIRSPHQSKGRRAASFAGDSVELVSIRSPHQSKGRPPLNEDPPLVMKWFQSAPLTKARGDKIMGRYQNFSRCFNPLPSPKQGETYGFGREFDILLVSIRSPHQSKGRLTALGASLTFCSFQSAPLTKARGDPTWPRVRSPVGICFNPLPSPKQGET